MVVSAVNLSVKESNFENLKKYFIKNKFNTGDVVFYQNEDSHDCFYIEEGTIALQYYDDDLGIMIDLSTHEAGEVVGAISVINNSSRSLTAVAKTPVRCLCLPRSSIENIAKNDVSAHKEFLDLVNASLIKRYRKNEAVLRNDAVSKTRVPAVDHQVEAAFKAHQEFISWPEEKVDQIIERISQVIYDRAEELAVKTREESGMGVVAHKKLKIKIGSLDVAQSLINKPGNGVLELESNGVEKTTMPVGVVFGMIPITNPVETIVFKTLIALKSRNSIIISSHRKGRSVGDLTVQLIRNVLKEFSAPEDLVQTPLLPANRKVTQAYMSHEDISMILATGGPSMVRSAYSSGTPAIGVGKGNAPVWICDDCDVASAAEKVINSKSFDNGVVCGSENNLLVDAAIVEEFKQQAIQQGAAVLDKDETERLLEIVFSANGRIAPEFIGQSAEDICLAINVVRDYDIKLLLADVAAYDFDSPLVREKLAPVLSLITVNTEREALDHVYEILELEGKGHTAIIHSQNKERINAFSIVAQVSRVLVATAGTQGCIGAENGLNLSWTLGCGTMGGGSVSDNVSYQHLQNTKRIAY